MYLHVPSIFMAYLQKIMYLHVPSIFMALFLEFLFFPSVIFGSPMKLMMFSLLPLQNWELFLA